MHSSAVGRSSFGGPLYSVAIATTITSLIPTVVADNGVVASSNLNASCHLHIANRSLKDHFGLDRLEVLLDVLVARRD